MQRYFVRQTIDLGGETQKVAADLNQFAVFDTNKYAQNPRQDFLNWALIDAGSFDYASDARGYTYGASLEWYATVDAVVAGERFVADFDIEILHSVRAASRRTTEAPPRRSRRRVRISRAPPGARDDDNYRPNRLRLPVLSDEAESRSSDI